jgi:GNAT superfamily N-acetyltransferase
VKPTIPLIFRPATDADLAYVVRTWIESYRDEQPEMRTSDYENWMRARINADVLLACHEATPEVIVGWIAADYPLAPGSERGYLDRLHYCYVRRRYRGQGIGRALFEQVTGGIVGGETIVTHLTDAGRAIKRAKPGRFRYLPL